MEGVVSADISPSLEKKFRAFICKNIQKNKHQEEIKPGSAAEFSILTNTHTKLYLLDMATVMQIPPSTFHILCNYTF